MGRSIETHNQITTMPAKHALNVDLAKVHDAGKPKTVITILNWGDLVEVTGSADSGKLPIKAIRYAK